MIEKLLSKTGKITRAKADIGASALIIAVSLFLLGYGIPKGISIGMAGVSKGANNPRTMPYIVSTVFLVMGILVLMKGISLYRADKAKKKEGQAPEETSFTFIVVPLALLGIAFALLFDAVGYIPLNIVAMIVVYYLFGGNKWYEALILSVVFTALMVLFFKYYLLINIPLGLGIG